MTDEKKKVGHIYMIKSHYTDEVYVGSTKLSLKLRMSLHKSHYKRWKEGKSKDYICSFKIIEKGDAYIEEVCMKEFNDKGEMYKIERETIRNTPKCCNKTMPASWY